MSWNRKQYTTTFTVQYIGNGKVIDWEDYHCAKIETVEKKFREHFERCRVIHWHKEIMEKTDRIVITANGKELKEIKIDE